MYVCNRCENVFDEDSLRTIRECVGEYWGSPAYQSYGKCPCCGSGSYSEAELCEECGEYCSKLELEYSEEQEREMWMCSRCAEHNREIYAATMETA